MFLPEHNGCSSRDLLGRLSRHGERDSLSGKLSEVGDTIAAMRQQAREQNGWIMDTYLLSKPS